MRILDGICKFLDSFDLRIEDGAVKIYFEFFKDYSIIIQLKKTIIIDA